MLVFYNEVSYVTGHSFIEIMFHFYSGRDSTWIHQMPGRMQLWEFLDNYPINKQAQYGLPFKIYKCIEPLLVILICEWLANSPGGCLNKDKHYRENALSSVLF